VELLFGDVRWAVSYPSRVVSTQSVELMDGRNATPPILNMIEYLVDQVRGPLTPPLMLICLARGACEVMRRVAAVPTLEVLLRSI
jgi:hypothetical protein